MMNVTLNHLARCIAATLATGVLSACDETRPSPNAAQTVEAAPAYTDSDIDRRVVMAAEAVTAADYAALGLEVSDNATGTPGARLMDFTTIGELIEPSDTSALQRGDVLTNFGDTPITSAADMKSVLTHFRPGTRVRAVVQRDGVFKEIFVTLGKARAGGLGANHA